MEARGRSQAGTGPFGATLPAAAAAATSRAESALCRSQLQAAESPKPDRETGQRRAGLGHSVAMSPARARYLVHLGGSEQVSGLQEGEDVQQLVYAQRRPHRFRSPRPAPPSPRFRPAGQSAPGPPLRPCAAGGVPAPGRTRLLARMRLTKPIPGPSAAPRPRLPRGGGPTYSASARPWVCP